MTKSSRNRRKERRAERSPITGLGLICEDSFTRFIALYPKLPIYSPSDTLRERTA